MSRPGLRLFAHRGSSARLPENTLEAFAAALDDGANALELDVHCTRDGHFVVAHDPTGQRVAGQPERIRDLLLEDVKRWNVAAGLGLAGAPRRAEMATLPDVLRAFPGVPLSVDLKPDAPGAVPDLIAAIARDGDPRLVTLASFHPRVVRRVRAAAYPGPTALTQPEVAAARLLPRRLARPLVRGQAAQIPRRGYRIRLDGRRFIARCRALGLRVDYWVVNDPVEGRRLLERGATGLMTDDPARMAALLQAPHV